MLRKNQKILSVIAIILFLSIVIFLSIIMPAAQIALGTILVIILAGIFCMFCIITYLIGSI